MINDLELLGKFARENSQDAFAEVVRRNLDLVYSAALRQVRSPQLAEEVAQSVFTDLAREAGKLKPEAILPAWLYTVTRRTAIDVIRKESRRQLREQIAMEMTTMNTNANDWEQVEPLLDEAMAELDETDRAAILLRYFESKSLREVGESLQISDDAAQKRVSRAVEHLREFFSKKNVTIGAGGLAVLISANAIQSAPVGLAAAISTAAVLTGTAVYTSTAIAATKAIAMTTIQKILVATIITATAGAGLYQAHQASVLRGQMQTLQQQQKPLADQVARLESENERLSRQVALTRDSRVQMGDLAKLKDQAAQARVNARKIAELKSALAQKGNAIPDFFTNAMATGLGTAEKWKLKDAQARIARMKKALNLTDDQVQALTGIMQTHIKAQTQNTFALISGKFTPEQQKAMGEDPMNEQSEIQAVFTPGQAAAYPQFQEAEKTFAANELAEGEASKLAGDFNLSPEQKEQIRTGFYQLNINENGQAQKAVADAKASGNLLDAANLNVDLQKSQLDEKMKVLGDILTPEQITSYRQEQMSQIDMQAAAMKMFVHEKPAATSN